MRRLIVTRAMRAGREPVTDEIIDALASDNPPKFEGRKSPKVDTAAKAVWREVEERLLWRRFPPGTPIPLSGGKLGHVTHNSSMGCVIRGARGASVSLSWAEIGERVKEAIS